MTAHRDRSQPVLGYENPACYARALGGCCQQVDGEHYISKAILEHIPDREIPKSKSVLVQNLSFQKQPDSLQHIRVNSLTANILCKVHNNLLSKYDAEGLLMYKVMDAIDDETRTPIRKTSVHIVNGDLLERWMLKSFIGGLYGASLRVPEGETTKGSQPPLEFLDILYRGASFPSGQGLFWMPPESGTPIATDNLVLRVGVLPSADGKVMGAFRTWFFGFEFNLLMATLAPTVPTIYDRASFRPAGIKIMGLHTQLQFGWASGPGSGDIILQRYRG